MQNFYEKTQWTSDAQGYDKSSAQFAGIATFLGLFGLLIAIIMFLVSLFQLGNGGWAGILGAITLAFQSVVILIFGSMMRGLSKVLLAVFEMSVSENRLHIYNTDPDKEQ